MELQLPESSEGTLVEGGDFRMDCYYRLASANFPEIDSLLLICPPDGSPPILLMFRISRTDEVYNVSEDTLRHIDNLRLPRGTRKYYVVVTPGGVEWEVRVPGAYFGRRGRTKLRDKLLQVFAYRVPVNVLFRDYSC